MVFRRRTVKNTRKFKPNSKTSIKTSTINKRSVGNNRTVKVSQSGSQQHKTHRPIFPQPGSSSPGDNGFGTIPPASAATVYSGSSKDKSQSSPTVTWDMSGDNTVYQPPKDYSSIYADSGHNIENSNKHNLLTPGSDAIQSRKITLEDKKKSYTEHTVNFKNLYGDDKITPVIVKTRGSHLDNDATVRRLAAMELQKSDAKLNHGNVFNHVYNTTTDNYVGFKDPSVSNSKNLTDSNRNPRLVKTKAPRLFGDRELPGIGRISYTGFAGGKTEKGDPFKFTKPKDVKKVWNTFGTPQWMEAKKLKPDVIEKRLNKQFENRSMSSFTESGRHKTSGGQNVFGSLDQYQDQKSIDWSTGGKDYTNPKWTRQEEQMKIYQAENKEKERIKKLKKNKPPEGSPNIVILSWEEQTGLKY